MVAMVESEKCKKQIRLCLEAQTLSKPPIIKKMRRREDFQFTHQLFESV